MSSSKESCIEIEDVGSRLSKMLGAASLGIGISEKLDIASTFDGSVFPLEPLLPDDRASGMGLEAGRDWGNKLRNVKAWRFLFHCHKR